MFFRLVSVCIFLCFSFLFANAESKLYFLDKNQLQKLFESKQFDELERKLDKLQIDYEHNASMEYPIWQAYTTFENADPEYKFILKEWLVTSPDSYIVNYASGRYYLHLARITRGSSWGSTVLPEQYEEMDRYLDKAQNYFLDAAKKNDRFSEAYVGLIEVAIHKYSRAMTSMIIEDALNRFPLSLNIRWRYLESQQPKWGGSLEEIDRFVEETRLFYDQNWRLSILDGYEDMTRADMALIREKDIMKAQKFITDAIKKGPTAGAYYLQAGRIFNRSHNYDKELEYYTEAEKYAPQISYINYVKAVAYWNKSDMKRTKVYLDEALKFDRYNPKYLAFRGRLFERIGKQNEAIADYENSLLYGKWNTEVLQKLYDHYSVKAQMFHSFLENVESMKKASLQ